MSKRTLLVLLACVLIVLGVGATAALAGEITGPPGTPGTAGSANGKPTGAPDNANSFCAYSGLNDMNPDEGQIDRQTQTPKDGPAGAPGHGIPGTPFADGCHGGTNPERTK